MASWHRPSVAVDWIDAGSRWHWTTSWHSTSVAAVLTGGMGDKVKGKNDSMEVSESFLYHF